MATKSKKVASATAEIGLESYVDPRSGTQTAVKVVDLQTEGPDKVITAATFSVETWAEADPNVVIKSQVKLGIPITQCVFKPYNEVTEQDCIDWAKQYAPNAIESIQFRNCIELMSTPKAQGIQPSVEPLPWQVIAGT